METKHPTSPTEKYLNPQALPLIMVSLTLTAVVVFAIFVGARVICAYDMTNGLTYVGRPQEPAPEGHYRIREFMRCSTYEFLAEHALRSEVDQQESSTPGFTDLRRDLVVARRVLQDSQ